MNIHKFGEIEERDCFEDGINDILYFPIKDSEYFPQTIMDKAEKMVNSVIGTYETENSCKLDLSKLRLNARLIVYLDKGGNWSSEISVLISDSEISGNIWREECYKVMFEDPLYESFKAYFMEQLENSLFKR